MTKLNPQEMLRKYNGKIAHSQEVQRLAIMLFYEASKKIHEMPPEDLSYLKAAALLHDIGYYMGSKGHNKYSLKMILDEGLTGFDYHELKIIGCICRYHRGSLPDKSEHEIYRELDKEDRKRVKRLGGIVKLADGLAADKLAYYDRIKIDYNAADKIAKLTLVPDSSDSKPDIRHAIRKRDLFEVGFKCQSVLVFGYK